MSSARLIQRRSHGTIAVVALVALALQSILLTFAPPAVAVSVPAHAHHDLADAHEGVPPPPSDDASHHAGLCCILGNKLGTALGPVATPPSLATPPASRVVPILPRRHITIASRLYSGALGARAPPLAS